MMGRSRRSETVEIYFYPNCIPHPSFEDLAQLDDGQAQEGSKNIA